MAGFIHKGRIFDIASGLGSKLESTVKILNARSTALLSKASESFRSVIDGATPAVYVLNFEEHVYKPLAEAYGDTPELRQSLLLALDNIGNSVSYNDLTTKLNAAYTKAQNSFTRAAEKGSSHLDYRNIARLLGVEIRQAFKSTQSKQEIARLIDGHSNFGNATHVYFAPNFELVKKTINKELNAVLKNIYGGKQTYGAVMHAGHTAVDYGDSTYGINTPLIQQYSFLIEHAASKGTLVNKELANFGELQSGFVKSVPLFTKYKIDISEDFSPTARNLIEMNFSFVVPMPGGENASSGTRDELNYIKRVIGDEVLADMAVALKERVKYLSENSTYIKLSPTIIEYIEEVVRETIKGNPTKNYRQNLNKAGMSKAVGLVIPKAPLKQPKLSTSKFKIRTPKGTFISPISIQTLINGKLAQQIQANMGKGNAKAVLNYRTGRFAESANVQRVSARNGQVDAFYTYMKNPYATFEPDGAQGSPTSRDPRKLIEKSIRQIAAEIMTTRLRAIPV